MHQKPRRDREPDSSHRNQRIFGHTACGLCSSQLHSLIQALSLTHLLHNVRVWLGTVTIVNILLPLEMQLWNSSRNGPNRSAVLDSLTEKGYQLCKKSDSSHYKWQEVICYSQPRENPNECYIILAHVYSMLASNHRFTAPCRDISLWGSDLWKPVSSHQFQWGNH